MILFLNWAMIKIFVAMILYAMCIGWMTKMWGSRFLGVIAASILIYIAWENEIALYGIFTLFFFNRLIGGVYNIFHVRPPKNWKPPEYEY